MVKHTVSSFDRCGSCCSDRERGESREVERWYTIELLQYGA